MLGGLRELASAHRVGKEVWLLDVTCLRASRTPPQMPLRDGNLQAMQPLWLLANNSETENQDLILLSPPKPRWLSSGIIWVFPSRVWAGGDFSEGRLGGVAMTGSCVLPLTLS